MTEILAGIKGFDFICEFFIKSTIILTFTFLLVFLFRKKSASIRHFLLSVSLLCLLLLPFLSTLTQGWETGLLPSWQTSESSSQVSLRWDQFRKTTIPLNSISPTLSDPQLTAQKLENNSQSNFFLSKYSISKGILGSVLIFIWSAGLLVLLSRILLGIYGAHKLTRQGKEISDSPWRQLLNRFLKAISIKRKINLFSHKNVSIPLTWGVLKPVVILPAESRNWTQDQCSSALFHELSHIKRGDFLIKILARCSIALYWFNPLCWFAFRMMKKEQEKACDELVLRTGVKPSTYAVNLLSIKKAGQFQWNPPTAALGAVGKSQLNERLTAILKQQLKPKEVNMKTKILLSSLIISAIAFIGLARPSQSEAFTETILPPESAVLADAQETTQEVSIQEKQVEKTIKKTDEQESKHKVKKSITWISEDGEKFTFTILEDEEGTISISGIDTDMLFDIDKDSDENKFTLRLKDKNLILQKDEEGNWSLQSDKGEKLSFQISTSEKHDKKYSVVYRIKTDKDDKSTYVVKASPYIHIEKHKTPKGAVDIHISPKTAIKNKRFDIHFVPKKGEVKYVTAKPYVELHAAPYTKAFTIRNAGLDQKELKEKLAKILEKLKEIREKNKTEMGKEAKEDALEEVEDMLKKLSEEIKEKKTEIADIALSVHADIEDLHLDEAETIDVDVKDLHLDKTVKIEKLKDADVALAVHIDEADDIKWVSAKDVNIDILDGKKVTFITTDEGEFQISMKAHFDSESKAKYDEIIEKLKKDLPKGSTVEPIFDEEAELITINIKGTQKGKKIGDEIKKILKDLEKQFSSIKQEKKEPHLFI